MTAKSDGGSHRGGNRLGHSVQELPGHELARMEAFEEIRRELQLGVDQLDADLGEDLDIEAFIVEARRAHAAR